MKLIFNLIIPLLYKRDPVRFNFDMNALRSSHFGNLKMKFKVKAKLFVGF